MANGVLSSYFETDRAKAAKKAGGMAGYGSAPAEDAGGAPTGGAPAPAPSSPKPPTTTSGSGFVGFGQYFGANAPAVQAQAQQAVGQTATTKAFKAPQGASGLALDRQRFGPMPSAATMLERQAAGPSPSTQLSQIPGQMEGLKQAAESGYMGENVSAFDQMLGGGVTQQAARQEQQRLGALRTALEGEQAQYQQAQAAKADAERQAKQAAEWQAWWDNERRRAEYAEQQRQAEEGKSFWESLGLGAIAGK